MDVFMGIDIGTTHCKVGILDAKGQLLSIARYPDIVYRDGYGSHYRPEEIWESVYKGMKEVLLDVDKSRRLISIGITSMAETGMLIDPENGSAYTELLPWFDTRAMAETEYIKERTDSFDMFSKTGLRANHKQGLSKLLWILKSDGRLPKNAKWLSASDYIAFKLTGNIATDHTLAARTFAYDLKNDIWNTSILEQLDIEDMVFPEVVESGIPMGLLDDTLCRDLEVSDDIPVCICGHDHVCAAFGAGVVDPGTILDSMGTAETLVGVLPESPLGLREWNSGFSFGRYVLDNRYFWMGGLPASGGSIEWSRNILSDSSIDYSELAELLECSEVGPTGILYFPYLSGGSSPVSDIDLTGTLIGLKRQHTRADLAKAIIEGAAYEVEYMRQVARESLDRDMDNIIVVGGGTQNEIWLKIKANVFGVPIKVVEMPEATLMGAAFLAAHKSGYFPDEGELYENLDVDTYIIYPDNSLSAEYGRQFVKYREFQEYLKQYYVEQK